TSYARDSPDPPDNRLARHQPVVVLPHCAASSTERWLHPSRRVAILDAYRRDRVECVVTLRLRTTAAQTHRRRLHTLFQLRLESVSHTGSLAPWYGAPGKALCVHCAGDGRHCYARHRSLLLWSVGQAPRYRRCVLPPRPGRLVLCRERPGEVGGSLCRH